MQSTRLPVGLCPDYQTTLLDRVANRAIFPRTSYFSAYVSRVPDLAYIRPAMYDVPFFSMGCKSQFKSHAEIHQNNIFLLIFH
jgi:hypothetical protein